MQSNGLNEHKAFMLKVLLGKQLIAEVLCLKISVFLLETTQIPLSDWMVKQHMLYPFRGILCSNKKEQTIVYSNLMDLEGIMPSEKNSLEVG